MRKILIHVGRYQTPELIAALRGLGTFTFLAPSLYVLETASDVSTAFGTISKVVPPGAELLVAEAIACMERPRPGRSPDGAQAGDAGAPPQVAGA